MMGRRSSLFTAFYILFLDNFGFAITFPIFPILFLHPSFDILPHEMLDSTRNFFLGVVLAAFPLAQFFGAPFFGDIADRFGRKKAFFWTISGTVIGYCLTALGILLHLYSLILFSRLFTGFFAGNLAISMATISDLSPSKTTRGKNISYVTTCLGGSWILAIIVGALFSNPQNMELLDPSLPFWIIAVASLSSLLVLAALFYETLPNNRKNSLSLFKGVRQILHVLEQKQLRVLYLILFFWLLGFFISLQWVAPLSIEKYHAAEIQIMWLFVAYGLIWTFSSGIINPYFVERFSLWKTTLWSLFFLSLFFFFAAVSDFLLYFMIAYAISGFFSAIAWSNSMNLISLSASQEEQGKSLGIGQSMTSLAQVFGPLFGGFVAGLSVDPLFFVCAFLVVVAFLFLLVYVLQRKNKLLKKR